MQVDLARVCDGKHRPGTPRGSARLARHDPRFGVGSAEVEDRDSSPERFRRQATLDREPAILPVLRSAGQELDLRGTTEPGIRAMRRGWSRDSYAPASRVTSDTSISSGRPRPPPSIRTMTASFAAPRAPLARAEEAGAGSGLDEPTTDGLGPACDARPGETSADPPGEAAAPVLSVRHDSITAAMAASATAPVAAPTISRRPRRGRGVSVMHGSPPTSPVGAVQEDRCPAMRTRLAFDVAPSRSMTMPPAIGR